jgi:hypothetical protein
MPKKKYRRERELATALTNLIYQIERATGLRALLPSSTAEAYPSPATAQGRLVAASDAAKQLGVSSKTLANWRTPGTTNLPFVMVGGRVFYRQSDIDAFVKGSTMLSTSERRGRK